MKPENIDDRDGVPGSEPFLIPASPDLFDDLGLTDEEITIFGDDDPDEFDYEEAISDGLEDL